MKKKILTSSAILLLSGIAFFANNAFAKTPNQNADPNVAALKVARAVSTCYMQKDSNACKKEVATYACALCDDDLIIKPKPQP